MPQTSPMSWMILSMLPLMWSLITSAKPSPMDSEKKMSKLLMKMKSWTW